MKIVLCKNCEYFKELENTNLQHKDFGDCKNRMIEQREDWYPPSPSTKVIIRVLDESDYGVHVHKDFGCIEGEEK